MNDFFKMNPIAVIAMTLLVFALIGSAEHTYSMMSGYFQVSFIALLVVLAVEVGVLVSAWQKGANMMRLENSFSLSVFNAVVIINVFMANMSQSYQQRYNVDFTFSGAWSLDWASLIMWFVVSCSIPTLVLAMTHVVSKNFSKKAVKAYTDTVKQPKQQGKPDYSSMTVDQIKDAMQLTLNDNGFRGIVTDEMIAKELGITARQVRRRRKAEREEDDNDDWMDTVTTSNGKFHVG